LIISLSIFTNPDAGKPVTSLNTIEVDEDVIVVVSVEDMGLVCPL
jgi:hypothetical protein